MTTPIFRNPAGTYPSSVDLPPSAPIRRFDATEMPEGYSEMQAAIARGDAVDPGALNAMVAQAFGTLQRGITSQTTGFPVRENLDPQVRALLTSETPVRSMIPRVRGAGTAASWKQLTSYGGGWGSGFDQPGGGTALTAFFPETGAPAEVQSQYANKSAAYKLLGFEGSVTGFAMAAGANFQDQYEVEKAHAVTNLMLMEEDALINGDATSTAAPWGDGTNNYAFNGLLNLITTANGTPSANIQTSVGALTLAHIDSQLTRIWSAGGRDAFMLMNFQEARSIRNLAANASNGLYKIAAEGSSNGINVGMHVTGYVHPLTGEIVRIITSRFVPAGTMIFGALHGPLPTSSYATGATLQVNVLPQVQLPKLAPSEQVEGYVAQELAPTAAQPLVYRWLVSVFEVLQMLNATVFAKSTGVTAV